MQTKTCTKCGEDKPLSDYHKDKRTVAGVRSDCKICVRLRMSLSHEDRTSYYRQRYQDNKESRREKERDYYDLLAAESQRVSTVG